MVQFETNLISHLIVLLNSGTLGLPQVWGEHQLSPASYFRQNSQDYDVCVCVSLAAFCSCVYSHTVDCAAAVRWAAQTICELSRSPPASH